MNAAVVRSYDAPPSYTTFDEPVAGEGEVLVTVTAAGLHPIVKSLANGTHYGSTGILPFVPGVDGVGRLEDGTASLLWGCAASVWLVRGEDGDGSRRRIFRCRMACRMRLRRGWRIRGCRRGWR